jgi:glycosyltransferase involved in cell wall biosynthesis
VRILAFNYEYPPLGGGGGVVFQAMYDELAKRHEVTIVTSGHRDLPRLEARGGQQIHRVPILARRSLTTASFPSMLSYVPSSWRAGRALLAAGRFELINTHFVVPTGPAPQDLSRRFKLPNVLSIHGGDIFDPSKRTSPHRLPLVRTVVRRLLEQADRVVAQSTNTRDNARLLYRIDRAIDVVPLGIALPRTPPRDRAALGIGEDRFVMVTVGRIVARKGIEALIELVRRLDDPRDLLVVAGGGPLRSALEEQARALGVGERVRFVGRISEDDKWRWLAASDLFVSTALHEGFGLVFLEGMHAGLPIACYDSGGQTDFLEHDRTGAVIATGDLEGFAAAVRRLKGDAAFRVRCAGTNRVRVADYSIDRCAARYEALFEEVAATARR